MAPGFPISISVFDDKILAQESHFSSGSKFKNERIGSVYYLKYESSYITITDNIPVIVDDIVVLDDLVYIEPYDGAIFHLKYKNECIFLNIESLSADCNIKFQWATFDISHSAYEQDAYVDTYGFLGPYRYDYLSVDGFDLLNPTKSFSLISDSDFNMNLSYDQEEYVFKFQGLETKAADKLMFIENDEDITIYSEEFGYLQVGCDEDNEENYPVFSHDHYGFLIVLEQARLYSTYYLKYESSYVELIQHEGVFYGILTNNKDEASVFQAISYL
jgi:hypothetical protein